MHISDGLERNHKLAVRQDSIVKPSCFQPI
jgi:hypothetical protein